MDHQGNNKQHLNKDLRVAVILRATLENRAEKSGKAEDYEKYKKQQNLKVKMNGKQNLTSTARLSLDP